MRRFLAVVAFLLVVLLAGCETYDSTASDREWDESVDDMTNGLVGRTHNMGVASQDPEYSAGDLYSDSTTGMRMPAKAAPVPMDAPAPMEAGPEPASPPRDRLLIQRGQIRVEVPRPDDVARDFLAKVVAWGGYLQNQQDLTLTVRLPAAKFDEAFAAVRAFGRVLGESRQADDVTEEFVDLGIRLDNARKSRDRLLEILQKADKVEDILKVEAELRRLTEEIERMEGRRKFLADQVALATLQVTLQATAEAPPGKRTRQRNRFEWINRVGAESMMGDF